MGINKVLDLPAHWL